MSERIWPGATHPKNGQHLPQLPRGAYQRTHQQQFVVVVVAVAVLQVARGINANYVCNMCAPLAACVCVCVDNQRAWHVFGNFSFPWRKNYLPAKPSCCCCCCCWCCSGCAGCPWPFGVGELPAPCCCCCYCGAGLLLDMLLGALWQMRVRR